MRSLIEVLFELFARLRDGVIRSELFEPVEAGAEREADKRLLGLDPPDFPALLLVAPLCTVVEFVHRQHRSQNYAERGNDLRNQPDVDAHTIAPTVACAVVYFGDFMAISPFYKITLLIYPAKKKKIA